MIQQGTVQIAAKQAITNTIPTQKQRFSVVGSSSASWSLFSSPFKGLQIVVDSRSAKIKVAPVILIFLLVLVSLLRFSSMIHMQKFQKNYLLTQNAFLLLGSSVMMCIMMCFRRKTLIFITLFSNSVSGRQEYFNFHSFFVHILFLFFSRIFAKDFFQFQLRH